MNTSWKEKFQSKCMQVLFIYISFPKYLSPDSHVHRLAWVCFSFLALSLKWNVSHNKRKQATEVPRNRYHGLFNVNTAEEKKAKAHVFRQREISSTHIGPECRTAVMQNELFGFSLILWCSRLRPRCHCFKSLIAISKAREGIPVWISLQSCPWSLDWQITLQRFSFSPTLAFKHFVMEDIYQLFAKAEVNIIRQ